MNQLVIIGNGFDLAHGLKTSYQDFIVWYLNKTVTSVINEGHYVDSLMTCSAKTINFKNFKGHQIISIKEFNDFWGRLSGYKKVNERNIYMNQLLLESINGWIDIENFYYKNLVRLNRMYTDSQNSKELKKSLRDLNTFMDGIKVQLNEYLTELGSEIKLSVIEAINTRVVDNSTLSNIMFLNFNYTGIISKYIPYLKNQNVSIINIHGSLNSEKNPMIFGYGDDSDEKYRKIEATGNDDYLEHIKSFWYLKTKNYQTVMGFMEAGSYEVRIAGHSCGLSDKVLLSEIFTHRKCVKIDILYHDMGDGKNDYTQKLYAISRQFPHEFKNDMRKKIIPFEKSVPLLANKNLL